jgi:HD-like signal output (HDOD) protein
MSSKQVIDDIINRLDKLPTLPVIAIKVLEAIQSKETRLQELVEIFSTDPPLSTEVLRLINSSYYDGLNSKVTTVQHAVNLLGHDRLIKNFCQVNQMSLGTVLN